MLPFLLRFEFRKAEFAEEAKDSFASFLSSAKRKRSAEEARSLASSLSFARQNSGPLTRRGGSSPKGRAWGFFLFASAVKPLPPGEVAAAGCRRGFVTKIERTRRRANLPQVSQM